MSNFDDAVEIVLSHEGGYVNHPQDPGGETKYGISKRAYPNLDIKNLTRDQAKAIYKRDYWDRMRCDQFAPGVSLSLFDFGVNAGIRTASIALQRSCGATADGIIGPVTIARANSLHRIALIERFAQERIMHYTSLNTFRTFGRGWIRRTIEVLTTAILMKD